jgi:hypothetical protein
VILAPGVTVVLPLHGTTPTPWSMVHAVALLVVQDSTTGWTPDTTEGVAMNELIDRLDRGSRR